MRLCYIPAIPVCQPSGASQALENTGPLLVEDTARGQQARGALVQNKMPFPPGRSHGAHGFQPSGPLAMPRSKIKTQNHRQEALLSSAASPSAPGGSFCPLVAKSKGFGV